MEMRNKIVVFACLQAAVLFGASVSMATSNYVHGEVNPILGVPWVDGFSSTYDWSGWKASDNIVANWNSDAKQWRVPVVKNENGNNFLWAHLDANAAVKAGSAGPTCMQLIVNNWLQGNARVGASSIVCTSSTTETTLTTGGYIDLNSTNNAFVNFSVGGGGGAIFDTDWYAYGPNF